MSTSLVETPNDASTVLIGAPAGQPELAGWAALLGDAGAGIPSLRYLPERLSSLGVRIESDRRDHLSEAPSFVAFEGYDTIIALADALQDRAPPGEIWSHVAVEGTRGQIKFSRVPGISVWQ